MTKFFYIKEALPMLKEFDNIWKVMTEKQYNNQFTASLQNKQYEWWKEEKAIVDDELKF